ncbi:phytoene desaturase family protein [Streptomonospora nanhaiensis]|uniref:Phytoene desaturase n=1 Tax=Streptomonospora nanhaiensis TaxID=1323731 RepID=A0A853BJ08_9ACTN|nr:phytoene desaturase family protein [Streptomonospora nanhaiensis]MBV2365283.1 phytoene desaturase [Streptomonospora nanhaiensis]MBX9389832.1 phytoene desaturase [Streptomonospora nanhaiensis]NYI94715.1 phytoene desaturase [Streptomonospora nanhaiensis]
MATRSGTPRTVSGPTDHVVVVGAGAAGLSAALHLLGAGRSVTVLERDPHPGGRAGRLDVDGFRLDTGPTVLTMPELVDEALAAVGDSLDERLELTRLEPAYRGLFADGSCIDVHTGAEAMAAEVRRVAGPAEAAGYLRLRAWLGELYRLQMRRFIDANFDSPLDLLCPELARLAAIGGFGRLAPAVGRFLTDDRLRRLFTFQALYAGVPPRRALAAYAVIAYMDTVAGVYFPAGGMRRLGEAMAAAVAKAGGTLRYGTAVRRLERRGDRVTAAVTADGVRVPCDAVVLTPDLPMAYRLLGRTPWRPVPLRFSPSAVVLHAGTDRTWPHLAHHTVSFGAAWHGTFTEITRRGRTMSDPSLLITRPTATDPGLAPPGRHLLSVLAPCPNLRTGPADWRRHGPTYRDHLVEVLERRGFTGFGSAIVAEHLITPEDWSRRGMAFGTPFATAHTFAQTGPFRPRNLVAGTANAVLAGCGTTPGVGLPTAVVSGKLAAARIAGAAAVGARGGRR